MAINPLTDQDLQNMQEIVRTTPEILEFLERCKSCGLDAGGRIEACKAQDEFCRKVIAHFFPEHANG